MKESTVLALSVPQKHGLWSAWWSNANFYREKERHETFRNFKRLGAVCRGIYTCGFSPEQQQW